VILVAIINQSHPSEVLTNSPIFLSPVQANKFCNFIKKLLGGIQAASAQKAITLASFHFKRNSLQESNKVVNEKF